MYEPIHGSAPDIASGLAMMLRYTLNASALADRIEKAVSKVLDAGLRTGDIYTDGMKKVGTKEMGDAVAAAL